MDKYGMLLAAIPPSVIVLIVAVVVTAGILIALYFFGKKAQKKQDEQNALLQENKQYANMLVIDKKKLKITESGLPQQVIDQTPKYLRWQKLPIIKAKVGPQIVTMICDDKIFDELPIKKEIKGGISGLYLVDFKAAHGKLVLDDSKKKKKKKGPARWLEKLQEKAGAKPLK